MPINILMPALSPTMEKGNLAKWLKKEGDAIKSGDVLAEIETDKATMEVEAVDEGVLAKIVVPDGTADVPVNEVIGVIAGEGEDAKAVGAAPAPAAAAARQGAAASRPPKLAARRLTAPQRRTGAGAIGCRGAGASGQAAAASSPRRSPSASPRTPGSTSPRSRARARMAASSRRTSRPRWPAAAPRPRPAAAAAPTAAPPQPRLPAPRRSVGRDGQEAVRGRLLRGSAA